jgi:hypothetical protein
MRPAQGWGPVAKRSRRVQGGARPVQRLGAGGLQHSGLWSRPAGCRIGKPALHRAARACQHVCGIAGPPDIRVQPLTRGRRPVMEPATTATPPPISDRSDTTNISDCRRRLRPPCANAAIRPSASDTTATGRPPICFAACTGLERSLRGLRRVMPKKSESRRTVWPGGSHASAIVSGGWEYDRRASSRVAPRL